MQCATQHPSETQKRFAASLRGCDCMSQLALRIPWSIADGVIRYNNVCISCISLITSVDIGGSEF